MNRPQPRKPSARGVPAQRGLRAPQASAVFRSAFIPRGAETLWARSGWGADKGFGRRDGAAGTEAGLPRQVRGRDGLRGCGAGGAGALLGALRGCLGQGDLSLARGPGPASGWGSRCLAAVPPLAALPARRPAPETPRRLAHHNRAAAALAAPLSPTAAALASDTAMQLPRPDCSPAAALTSSPPATPRAAAIAAPAGRGVPGPTAPRQWQDSATVAEPISDEILPGGREPN